MTTLDTPVPTTPLLDRKAAAEFLTRHGYRMSPATLAKYACLGGSPPYRLFGRKPLYSPADFLSWAQSRTSPPRLNTSQAA